MSEDIIMTTRPEDIYVVENFEEAQQFRYEDTDEPVDVCTPVGIDIHEGDDIVLHCFGGIYFDGDGI